MSIVTEEKIGLVKLELWARQVYSAKRSRRVKLAKVRKLEVKSSRLVSDSLSASLRARHQLTWGLGWPETKKIEKKYMNEQIQSKDKKKHIGGPIWKSMFLGSSVGPPNYRTQQIKSSSSLASSFAIFLFFIFLFYIFLFNFPFNPFAFLLRKKLNLFKLYLH